MINKKCYLILIYSFCSLINFAQEPVFGQFNQSPIYMNPSLSGHNNVWSLNLNLKQQWPSITSKFLTQSISFDTPIYQRLSGSFCYLKNNEGEGFLKSNYYRGGLSYFVPISMKRGRSVSWKIGLEYQNYSKTIDWTRLVFLDQLHPLLGNINSTSFIPPTTDLTNTNNFHFGTLLEFNTILV